MRANRNAKDTMRSSTSPDLNPITPRLYERDKLVPRRFASEFKAENLLHAQDVGDDFNAVTALCRAEPSVYRGEVLFYATADGSAAMLDEHGNKLQVYEDVACNTAVTAVACSPEDFYTATKGGQVFAWRLDKPEAAKVVFRPPRRSAWGVSLLFWGSRLCVGDTMGTVTLLGPQTQSLRAHTGAVHALCAVPMGLATGGADARIQIWSSGGKADEQCSSRAICTLTGHSGAVLGLALCADGLCSTSFDRSVRVWDPESGQVGAAGLG